MESSATAAQRSQHAFDSLYQETSLNGVRDLIFSRYASVKFCPLFCSSSLRGSVLTRADRLREDEALLSVAFPLPADPPPHGSALSVLALIDQRETLAAESLRLWREKQALENQLMEARQRNQSLLIGNRDTFARMRAQIGKTREPKSVMVQKLVDVVACTQGR